VIVDERLMLKAVPERMKGENKLVYVSFQLSTLIHSEKLKPISTKLQQ
jgi:hypothetical protein